MRTSEQIDQLATEYRDIHGLDGYRVGADGTIWTCRRKGPGNYFNASWRRMIPKVDRYGYFTVGIRREGRKRFFTVHRLVLTAFVGPCPDGMQGCHNNGNKADCRVENLRWDTPAANIADKDIHGTTARGSRDGMSKLSDAAVREIRSRYSSGGAMQKELAKEYGVVQSLISAIVLRKIWTHI